MKKLIAKILIAAMVLTTVITPVEFGFAETGQAAAAEETVTEEMQFLYIEQQKVEAPGSQNIAISWEEDIDTVTKMLLVYENSDGQQFELEESERTEDSILFTKNFGESETGIYAVDGIKYFIGDEEKYLLLDDLEIDADFEVVDEIAEEVVEATTEEIKEAEELAEKVEDNLVVVETTGDDVNSQVVQTQVENILQEAQALKASKGRTVVVVLDPGHGGEYKKDKDPGATKKFKDGTILKESAINLKIAKACYDELNKYAGVDVYMTRTSENQNPSIADRVAYADKMNADVLVSIHINAAGSSKASGAEVWTPNKNYNKTVYNEGQAISKSILNELLDLGFDLDNRGVKMSYSQDGTMYKDKSLADYYGIIRRSKEKGFVGIIVEHAFITNDEDLKILQDDNKLKRMGIADALGIANHYQLHKGEWENTSAGKKFRYADGSYAAGYLKIGTAYYYFDKNGIMKTGLIKSGGKAYYFASNGKGTGKGWYTLSNGQKVYSKGNGVLALGYNKIGSYYYYFNASGIMQKYSQTIGGKPYYFRGTGKGAGKGWIKFKDGTKKYCTGNGKLAVGYKKIGKYYYGFSSSGKMLKYTQVIGGKPYYFKGTGKAAGKGWIKHKNGTKRYCYGNGKLRTGYKKVGKYYYFFDSKGAMKKGTQMVGKKPYYFKSSGKAGSKGWIKYKSGAKKYCYGKGKLATGYKKIGKYYYYFNASGTMQKYSQTISGKPYYFRGTGKAAGKGWLKFKSGTKKYCLGNGKLATGKVKISGTYYEFSSNGTYIGKAATSTPASSNYAIAGTSTVTVNQMVAYYKAMRGSSYPAEYKKTEAADIQKFCQIYYNECKAEGIKAEVAFCQAMKETDWLKFGGDVKISQYNFAGIGATGGGKEGHKFASVTMGIRGHVQHLKAYANDEELKNDCVDPRFKLVKRGAAPYVEWLGQKANPNGYGWAPAATYGTDIVKMIKELKTY